MVFTKVRKLIHAKHMDFRPPVFLYIVLGVAVAQVQDGAVPELELVLLRLILYPSSKDVVLKQDVEGCWPSKMVIPKIGESTSEEIDLNPCNLSTPADCRYP